MGRNQHFPAHTASMHVETGEAGKNDEAILWPGKGQFKRPVSIRSPGNVRPSNSG
jgi:hypothetical protein